MHPDLYLNCCEINKHRWPPLIHLKLTVINLWKRNETNRIKYKVKTDRSSNEIVLNLKTEMKLFQTKIK